MDGGGVELGPLPRPPASECNWKQLSCQRPGWQTVARTEAGGRWCGRMVRRAVAFAGRSAGRACVRDGCALGREGPGARERKAVGDTGSDGGWTLEVGEARELVRETGRRGVPKSSKTQMWLCWLPSPSSAPIWHQSSRRWRHARSRQGKRHTLTFWVIYRRDGVLPAWSHRLIGTDPRPFLVGFAVVGEAGELSLHPRPVPMSTNRPSVEGH